MTLADRLEAVTRGLEDLYSRLAPDGQLPPRGILVRAEGHIPVLTEDGLVKAHWFGVHWAYEVVYDHSASDDCPVMFVAEYLKWREDIKNIALA